jgi:formylglycine-generating enzyme required for sulfatase activity
MALRIPVEKALHLRQGVRMRLVLIPAGEFDMGSPPREADRGNDERLHRVRITQPFYLGKHPVTQEQWWAVMGGNPSRFKGARHPVEQVSWDECQEFLAEVNARAGRGLLALPTEAQWEYACRAGTRSACWFGNPATGLDKYAWYSAGFGDETHPVGAMPPNAWGLHDMVDYVGEWCSDWYSETYYARSPEEDPGGPEDGQYRVLRGASWYPIPKLARSACRRWARPTYRLHDLGFRVAARVQLDEPKGETDGKNDCVRPRTGNP